MNYIQWHQIETLACLLRFNFPRIPRDINNLVKFASWVSLQPLGHAYNSIMRNFSISQNSKLSVDSQNDKCWIFQWSTQLSLLPPRVMTSYWISGLCHRPFLNAVLNLQWHCLYLPKAVNVYSEIILIANPWKLYLIICFWSETVG